MSEKWEKGEAKIYNLGKPGPVQCAKGQGVGPCICPACAKVCECESLRKRVEELEGENEATFANYSKSQEHNREMLDRIAELEKQLAEANKKLKPLAEAHAKVDDAWGKALLKLSLAEKFIRIQDEEHGECMCDPCSKARAEMRKL